MPYLIYDDIFLLHRDELGTHPESPGRLLIALSAIRTFKLLDKFDLVKPPEPDINLLYKVHLSEYIDLVKSASLKGFVYIDSDTYVNRHTFDVATIAATSSYWGSSLSNSSNDFVFALIRPPGHHAGRRGKAMGAVSNGFCIFNNAALSAVSFLSKYRRVMIIDFDAHHGNGTQEIFWDNPRVLHIDIHQVGVYPGTGTIFDLGGGEAIGTKINIPLPHGSGDNAYESIISNIILPLADVFRPEALVVSAGFDAHHSDPLVRLKATAKSFYLLGNIVRLIGRKYCNNRIVSVLEGGYSEGFSKGLVNFMAGVLGLEQLILEDALPEHRLYQEIIKDVVNIASKYWNLA